MVTKVPAVWAVTHSPSILHFFLLREFVTLQCTLLWFTLAHLSYFWVC